MGFWSMAGLAVSFLILASLLLWLLIGRRGSRIAKVLLISVVLWYGLLVYYTPHRMLGWPVSGRLPDYAVLLDWKVIEPAVNAKEAGIYLWMVPKNLDYVEKEATHFFLLNPKNSFRAELKDVPRAYKLPYTREEHKRLGEAARERQKVSGLIMFRNGKGEKGVESEGEIGHMRRGHYEVLDPKKLLIKKFEEGETP